MSLGDLCSRRAVLLAIAEADQLGRERFRKKYDFKASTEYVLEHNGKEYDSKAIAAVAHGIAFPEEGTLKWSEFSGGRMSAAGRLDKLGFVVRGIRKDPTDWSVQEVELAVVDYFEMLRAELAGEEFNKSAHNEALREKLNNRSKGSVELKHQNISAVLYELGLHFIVGYKPRGNLQVLLKAVVLDTVENQARLFETPTKPITTESPLPAFVDPPPPSERKKTMKVRKAVKVDFAAKDEANRKLGHAGEEWAVEQERKRLFDLGQPDLAKGVKWVSESLGDGLGYDIASFKPDGSPLYIEVKTTQGLATAPFLVSPNEVAASSDLKDAYVIYRVFNFGKATQAFTLAGPIEQSCELSVAGWRATSKG